MFKKRWLQCLVTYKYIVIILTQHTNNYLYLDIVMVGPPPKKDSYFSGSNINDIVIKLVLKS